MSIKWSSKEIQQFLDLYKKHEILWNVHRRDYRSRDSRDVAWEELLFDVQSAGLSCENVNDLKNRIRILKTVYMQEVRKIKNSKDTAESLEDIYQPKLVWFDQADNFLKDVSRLRNFDTEKTINEKVKKEEVPSPNTNYNDHDDDSMQLPPPKSSPKLKTRKMLKRKRPISHINNKHIPKRIESNFDKEDQFDIVGRNVAMKLKLLPEEVQTYTEKFINDILFEARIGNITRHSRLHIVTIRKEEEKYSSQTELFLQEREFNTDEGEE